MRIALLSVLLAALAFLTVGVPTYMVLWNRAGSNAVTPVDGPGVVLGAFRCIGWTVAISSFVALCTFVITLTIARRKRTQKLRTGE